jgi:hypothetical protein
VIFRSAGADRFGVLSIASWYPWPKVDSDVKGVIAAATAAFVINDLLEFVIINY